METKRKIVVTAALPYANGDLHLGHLLEYSLADFWTRFQKLKGHDALYLCAEDTHGTPVMIAARNQGITPEELITRCRENHLADFKKFGIEFDFFSSTHCEANRQLVEGAYKKIKDKGHLVEKTLDQAYCEHDKMFLPDRFVKGICPKCGATDQYGDSCDVCGSTYQTADLLEAKCVLCGNQPAPRQTHHLFFKVSDFRDFLKSWVQKGTSQEVANKLNEWLDGELIDWCISRDAPYFGFSIPGLEDKYFYVWLDAPFGYLASLTEWCEKHGKKFSDYWSEDAEKYHIIGKDIFYFHGLFWPAVLKASDLAVPNALYVHGMLTVNGVKMSKSKGTFIKASTYLNHLNPLWLRYYLACKLNASIGDFDFSYDDFVSRVNSDLIGKITNVASRGASMLHKLDGVLGRIDPDAKALIEKAQGLSEQISDHFEARNFAKAMLLIREIADDANRYFDEHEPWKLIKTDPDKTKQVLTTILNLFKIMTIYLKPILPDYAAAVEKLFKAKSPWLWEDAQVLQEDQPIEPYAHLMKRIDPKAMQAMDKELKAGAKAPAKAGEKKSKKKKSQEKGVIDFSTFSEIDLRVARIDVAEAVPEADKLLRLEVDVGECGRKQIFAGIKKAYEPKDLVGRLTVIVNNLAPRQMRFGLSEGMVLAAGSGDQISLLQPDEGVKPGDPVS